MEARDTFGNTALHHQAGRQSGNILPLLELGADIRAVNHENLTPLHRAADSKNLEAASMMESLP